MVFVDLTSRSTSGGRKKQQRLEKGGNSFPETDENGKKQVCGEVWRLLLRSLCGKMIIIDIPEIP